MFCTISKAKLEKKFKFSSSNLSYRYISYRGNITTVIAHYALNSQMRSKAHTALTAPLVLHHTRIYKRAMKKIIFNGQRRNKHFLIVIYHSSLVKGRAGHSLIYSGFAIRSPLNFFPWIADAHAFIFWISGFAPRSIARRSNSGSLSDKS